jgi:hypothetical protein
MNLIRTFEFFSLAAVTFAVTIATNMAPSLAVPPTPTSLHLQQLPVAPIEIETTPSTLVSNATTIPASAPSLSVQQNIAKASYLEGFYVDSDWSVTLYRRGGKYNYRGKNLNTGSSLELSGATVSRTGSQQIYTWNNKGTKYRVTWKTNDSSKIRLQVINYNGRIILNRLLGIQNAADFL